MRRLGAGLAVLLLGLAGCGPLSGNVATPTPAPVATSYVAPLQTQPPTPEATSAPTPVPEDDTSVPAIITVEPPLEAATATAQP